MGSSSVERVIVVSVVRRDDELRNVRYRRERVSIEVVNRERERVRIRELHRVGSGR